jgi:two-component system OmpR family response regulator
MKEVLKVLIVDDELDICYLLSGILKQKNFKTAFVNNLSDAEIALRNEVPDVLFLDNHLPDGLGLDFVSFVKRKYPDTKIVMITAHDGPEERKRAEEEGADLFIAKPFTRNLITAAIDRLS